LDASIPAIDANAESAVLDFKSSFEGSAANWCELIKDIIAMANSGGGAIVVGVNDDGTPAPTDLTAILAIDPATIVDKIKKYTAQHFSGCTIAPDPARSCCRRRVCQGGVTTHRLHVTRNL
jgi:predicted HTH transcriptional regulator